MPSDDAAGDSPTPADASHPVSKHDGHAIDLEALAEQVYQLMLAEARLGRARGEEPPGRMEE